MTQRNAYDAAFELKAMDLAFGKGNRAAARELDLNESMIRQQQREFSGCGLYSGALNSRSQHTCLHFFTQ